MKFKFVDPEIIMTVVVSLIILAVGIFAFMITLENIPVTNPDHGQGDMTLTNKTFNAVMNASETGDSVFNIVGIILIIGAIMSIIGLVYGYMRPR